MDGMFIDEEKKSEWILKAKQKTNKYIIEVIIESLL